MFRLSFMFIALLTAGCVSLDPHYDRPAAPVKTETPELVEFSLTW